MCFVLSGSDGLFHVLLRLPSVLLLGLSGDFPGPGERSFPGVNMLWVHIRKVRKTGRL